MEYILKGDNLEISEDSECSEDSDAGERPLRGRGKVSSRPINRHLSHVLMHKRDYSDIYPYYSL